MSLLKFAQALVLSIVALVVVPHAFTQTYSVLYSFTGGKEGAFPVGPLIVDVLGNIYGATGGGAQGGSIFRIDLGGGVAVLHTFPRHGARGAFPSGGLVEDEDGNLYGATSAGGASQDPSCFAGGTLPSNGCGVIFKLNGLNKYSVLFNFPGTEKCRDGCWPLAPLTLDGAGNIYGTTFLGGSANCDPDRLNGSGGLAYTDCGVVFKVDSAGKETVLHRFGSARQSGDLPNPGLILDSAGNLYGSTQGGGINGNGGNGGAGTIFKLDPAGNETVLHFFDEFVDGDSPMSGLIRDNAGNLYGTTAFGPSSGSIYRLDLQGDLTQIHTFQCCDQGEWPYGGLVMDREGNLYGTTFAGGNRAPTCGFEGCGVIFKIDPSGNETVLYSFTGGADGGSPQSSLVMDGEGNLYGTTPYGGITSKLCKTGCGVVFKIAP